MSGSTGLNGAVFTQARTVPADHPAFAGHFPGQPILPGVALLAEVLAVWRAAGPALPVPPPTLRLAMAKFLAPVGPGAQLQIQLTADARQLRFVVSLAGEAAGQTAVQGAFALDTP
jgi:3-hydroxyacyl-[acyl-carrier-protein] dehydratase